MDFLASNKYLSLFEEIKKERVLECPKDGPDPSFDPDFDVEKEGLGYLNEYKGYREKLEEIADNPRSFFMYIDDINPKNLHLHSIYKDLDDILGYIVFDMHGQIYRQYIDDMDNREMFNSRFKLILDIIVQENKIEMMASNTIFRLEKMVDKLSNQDRLSILLRNSTHVLLENVLVILRAKQKLVYLKVKNLGKIRRNKKNKKSGMKNYDAPKKKKKKKCKKKCKKRFEIKEEMMEEMMEAYDAVKTIQKTTKVDLFSPSILPEIKIESD